MMGLISLIAVAVLLVAVVAYIVGVKAFLRHLELVHVAEFERLGRPQLGFQFGDPRYRNAMHYIRSKAFRGLDDRVLEARYRLLKRLEAIALLAAVVLLIAAAIG